MIKSHRGEFVKIVEEKDATPAERKVSEVNSGIYCFNKEALRDALSRLSSENSQREYYLTDTLALMKEKGMRVGVELAADARECFGVNTPEQLRMVEETLQAWGEG